MHFAYVSYVTRACETCLIAALCLFFIRYFDQAAIKLTPTRLPFPVAVVYIRYRRVQ